MANSGIYWIDVTFDWCVNFLYKIASLFGLSYEEISEINEVEVEEEKTSYLKIFGIIIIIFLILYFLELKN